MASRSLNESSGGNITLLTYKPLQTGIISLFLVSSLCLVATVFIQVVFWKHNRNTKILLCHAFTLMVYYSTSTARNFFADANHHPVLCYFFFVTMYYSGTTTIAWMSVMSYDVWIFLSDMQPSITFWRWRCPSCGRCKREHLFAYYSLVAWGLPLLSVATVVIIDLHRRFQEALNLYPKIDALCWYGTKTSTWIFSVGPMVVLSVVNVIFLVMTSVTIRQIRQNCKNVTNLNRSEQMFLIYIKLFAIMGVCLPGAAIVFAIDNDTVNWLGFILDGLQGVFVFFAHFFKCSTYELIKQKFCTKKRHSTTSVQNIRRTGRDVTTITLC